jgi:hypothetical protein
MAEIPAAQSSGQDIRGRGRENEPSYPPAARHRWAQKTVLTPIALAIISVALLVIALFLYPGAVALPTPPPPILEVSSRFPVTFINYLVQQKTTKTAKIFIEVDSRAPQAATERAGVSVGLPLRTRFTNCPLVTCKITPDHLYAVWVKPLVFRHSSLGWTASAVYDVQARSFDETFNGVEASAAIPDVRYMGSGTPTLQAGYFIKSASSYDWAAFPSLPIRVVNSYLADWQEPLHPGETAGQAVVGTDHSAQHSDDFKVFLAGALIALAGAAILTAAVEALHARDWAAIADLPHPPGASWTQRGAQPAADWQGLFGGADPPG